MSSLIFQSPQLLKNEMLFGSFCKNKREFESVSVLHLLRGGCCGEGDPRAPEV